MIFHTTGNKGKKIFITNNEKKKKNFDAVGWKSYCSRLYCGAGRWQALGARGWADCAQQALGESACWACQARVAGGCERAWRAGRAGARRANVLGRAGRQAHGRWRVRARARRAAAGRRRRRAAGRWERGRALGARQAGAGRKGRARPGRLGWPWAVHSVHSAHFRSVLTLFFPESPNEHCSL